MRFGLCLGFAAVIAMAAPAPVTAQFGTRATSQTLRHVHTLPTHTERMHAALMLIAMGVDADSQVPRLRDARADFVAVLNGLRYGDTMMEVPLLDEPEVTRAVEEVRTLWPGFDDIVYRGTKDGALTAADVRALSDLARPLSEAAREASQAFGSVFAGGNIPSILVGTTLHCEAQASLVQSMLGDYLMIAYGHDVERHGARLEAGYARYDRVAAGLVAGDPELRLLPAATPEIAARLAAADRRWQALRPFLATARQSGRASREQAALVAETGEALYRELVAIAELYAAL